MIVISDRLHVPQTTPVDSWLVEENFELAWARLVDLGVPLRDKAEAWSDLRSLRAGYGDQLEQLIDFLVAPRGVWGHSAEDTAASEVAAAAAEARRTVRTRRYSAG